MTSLPEGYYKITVNYKPRSNALLSECKFAIYYNATKLISIQPLNFSQGLFIQDNLRVIQNNSKAIIKICGEGTSTDKGTFLTFVKFERYAYTNIVNTTTQTNTTNSTNTNTNQTNSTNTNNTNANASNQTNTNA